MFFNYDGNGVIIGSLKEDDFFNDRYKIIRELPLMNSVIGSFTLISFAQFWLILQLFLQRITRSAQAFINDAVVSLRRETVANQLAAELVCNYRDVVL